MEPSVRTQGDEVIITFPSEHAFVSISCSREEARALTQRLISRLGLPWDTKHAAPPDTDATPKEAEVPE